MRFRFLLLLLALVWGLAAGPRVAWAVFASPINGGCYLAGPNDCRIHLDPIRINLRSGSTLVAFRIQANGQTIYDFRTDVSNPPPAPNYSPTLPALDFAATCGTTYTINMIARDSLDTNFLNAGQFAGVVCPAGTAQTAASPENRMVQTMAVEWGPAGALLLLFVLSNTPLWRRASARLRQRIGRR